MHDGLTRRGVLRLCTALTAAVPVLTCGAAVAALPAPEAPPPEAPRAESVDRPSRPTQLETYLRSRGIRPAHLAREAGYQRAHLLRVRIRRVEPTPAYAVGIVYALRRLAREPIVLSDVFTESVADAAWQERRAIVQEYHPFEHRAVRTVFGQGGRRG